MRGCLRVKPFVPSSVADSCLRHTSCISSLATSPIFAKTLCGTRGKKTPTLWAPLVMAAVVKEEPEAPYSLPLLLGDRNPRCRAMTASALTGAPPPPAQNQQNIHAQAHTSIQQQQQQQLPQQQQQQQIPSTQQTAAQPNQHPPPLQPLMNGMGQYDKVPARSPSSMTPAEPTKRHPSPNKPPSNVSIVYYEVLQIITRHQT